jgi:hypothetical protein
MENIHLGCFKCGVGNLPKGVRAVPELVGAHNWYFVRIYCDCKTGKFLEDKNEKAHEQNKT